MYIPKPKKLGHLVLKVRNIKKSVEFYTEVVGLKVSDWIDDRMVFLRSGEDHHDLGLLQMTPAEIGSLDPGATRIEHFSYQVDNFAEIEMITTMLQTRCIDIDRGMGKHGPGGNTFIVFKDPDGNNVEFYSDMQQIPLDQEYQVSVWSGRDLHTFDRWNLDRFVVDPPARIQALLDCDTRGAEAENV